MNLISLDQGLCSVEDALRLILLDGRVIMEMEGPSGLCIRELPPEEIEKLMSALSLAMAGTKLAALEQK